MRCVVGEQDGFGGHPELCFDKSTGELVEWSFPFISTGREITSTCFYGNFQKFGDKLFPASIRCTEDGKQILDGTVSNLSVPISTDMALFDSLPGGREFSNCPTGLKQPQVLERPVANGVAGDPVVLSMTVGTDGKPHDLKVFTSAGKASDEAAIDAVRRWRFKPATCNGEPIEAPINVAYSDRR
jgi:TonB family protein